AVPKLTDAHNFQVIYKASPPLAATDRVPPRRRSVRLRRLLREADAREPDTPPAADMTQLLDSALWAPLPAACPHVRRWHLVLHPAARNLPVRLGAPAGHQVQVHAGVAFYAQGRERRGALATRLACAAAAGTGIAVHVDAARPTVGVAMP